MKYKIWMKYSNFILWSVLQVLSNTQILLSEFLNLEPCKNYQEIIQIFNATCFNLHPCLLAI